MCVDGIMTAYPSPLRALPDARERDRAGTRGRRRPVRRVSSASRALIAAVGLALVALIFPTPSQAALSLDPIGSFSDPVYVTSDPDDPNRLFVVELLGVASRLRAMRGTSTFLDLTQASPPIVQAGGEQGLLLSPAFPGDFRATGRFYVFFTNNARRRSRGRRVHIVGRRQPLSLGTPAPGCLVGRTRFIGTTTGGSCSSARTATCTSGRETVVVAGDPGENAHQDQDELLGNILRINPEALGHPAVLGAARQPVRGGRRSRRDLVVRPAEPVAVLLRRGHRATSSSATSARAGGRRSTSRRLPRERGEAPTSAGTVARGATSSSPWAARASRSPTRCTSTRTPRPPAP